MCIIYIFMLYALTFFVNLNFYASQEGVELPTLQLTAATTNRILFYTRLLQPTYLCSQSKREVISVHFVGNVALFALLQ